MVKEERWRLYLDGNQSYREQVKRARVRRYGERRRERTRCRTPAKTTGGGTAGACAARAVSGLPGNGFELLLGTFCACKAVCNETPISKMGLK
jgi:hypothetical protein